MRPSVGSRTALWLAVGLGFTLLTSLEYWRFQETVAIQESYEQILRMQHQQQKQQQQLIEILGQGRNAGGDSAANTKAKNSTDGHRIDQSTTEIGADGSNMRNDHTHKPNDAQMDLPKPWQGGKGRPRTAKVAYLQMLKTGGSTFRQILSRYARARNITKICPYTQSSVFLQHEKQESLKNYDMIFGQYDYRLLQQLPPEFKKMVTVRHPIHRLYSIYFSSAMGDLTKFKNQGYTFYRFLEEYTKKKSPNYQCRMLGISSEEMVKPTLESFDWIGITHIYDQSLLLLQEILGRAPLLYQAKKVSIGLPDLALLDRRFYSRFEKMMCISLQSPCTRALSCDVSVSAIASQLTMNRLYERYGTIERINNITIDFRTKLPPKKCTEDGVASSRLKVCQMLDYKKQRGIAQSLIKFPSDTAAV